MTTTGSGTGNGDRIRFYFPRFTNSAVTQLQSRWALPPLRPNFRLRGEEFLPAIHPRQGAKHFVRPEAGVVYGYLIHKSFLLYRAFYFTFASCYALTGFATMHIVKKVEANKKNV